MAATGRNLLTRMIKCPKQAYLLRAPSYLSAGKRCMSEATIRQELAQETPADMVADPLKSSDYFQVRSLVTVEDMFRHCVHYGHHAGCRNDHMKPFLFGTRMDIDIFDLDKTLPLFQDALNFTAHIAYRNGIILFISRSKLTMPLVEATAKNCGEYAHCRYWGHGTFTDSRNVFGQVVRLPDLCIFLNTQNSVFETHRAVIDSAKLLIPTVGVVDSNCDPRLISYPIPGNDDTSNNQGTILYYLRLFEDAIKRGKAKRKEDGLD